MKTQRLTCAAAAGGLALLALATPASAADVYQYTVHEHHASATFTDVGLCDTADPATITLSDYNEVIHLASTLGGLTDAQVEALLDDESGEQYVQRVTYTQTGSFSVTEGTGVTYTGHFTNWFGFSDNRHTDVYTGIFEVHGTGSDGSTISAHFTAHETLVDGVPVVELDKGTVSGCL